MPILPKLYKDTIDFNEHINYNPKQKSAQYCVANWAHFSNSSEIYLLQI